jgi:hypothetical protein
MIAEHVSKDTGTQCSCAAGPAHSYFNPVTTYACDSTWKYVYA